MYPADKFWAGRIHECFWELQKEKPVSFLCIQESEYSQYGQLHLKQNQKNQTTKPQRGHSIKQKNVLGKTYWKTQPHYSKNIKNANKWQQ